MMSGSGVRRETATALQFPLRASIPGTPLLAAVRLDSPGDGVAYVARLLATALHDLGVPGPIVELRPRIPSSPTLREQFGFLTRLTKAQAREADWALFTHLGLARAQPFVPARWRKPYAVFLHGIEVWDPELSPARRRVLRGASLRVANSVFTARKVESVHPDVGPVQPCLLALHPDDGPSDRDAADASVLGLVLRRSVVIIGRMSAGERYKGHDALVECWPRVLTAVPDAQLVVLGRGDDRDRLVAKAKAGQLGDSVLFPGFVDDATRDAVLSKAAVFAMPSQGEGFGIVYLQAMRAGRPCIGSTVDAATDVIVDGVTGRLVDPDDRAALAGAIVSLLQDQDLCERMGAAGRRRFEAEFTYDRFRHRLATILARSLGVESN